MYFTEPRSYIGPNPVTVEKSKAGEYTLAGSEGGTYRLSSISDSDVECITEKETTKTKVFALYKNKTVIVTFSVIIICCVFATIGVLLSYTKIESGMNILNYKFIYRLL